MEDDHNDNVVVDDDDDVDPRPPPPPLPACHPLDVSMMFLGTASMRPSMSRNVSGNALKIGNEICIVDCGEGTQHQIVKVAHQHNHQYNNKQTNQQRDNQQQSLSRSSGEGSGGVRGIRIAPGSITRIFITHLHGDHCFGLAGLLCLIDNNSHKTRLEGNDGDEDESENGSSSSSSPSSSTSPKVVQIVGPKGLRNMIRAALISSSTNFSFQIRIDELIFHDKNPTTTTSSSATTTNKTTKLRHFATVFEVPPHLSEIPGIDVVSQHQQDGSTWWTLPCHPNIASNKNNNNKTNNGGQVAAAWTMYAAPLVHSIESVGYVFHEHPHQGKLDQTKLQTIKQLLLTEENRRYQLESCGIKNPLVLFGSLQRGEEVTILNKNNQLQTLHPKDCMSPNTPGRKIVILGDTCDSRQLSKLAANADVIVHEATNAAIEQDETVEGVLRTAISRGHSTPGMAGTFAKCCQAKQLILTHFSSRYKGDDSPESLEVMSKIVQEAQESFGNDNVIAARDLMHISIAINRRERRREEEEEETEAEAENDCIMRVQNNTKNDVQPDVAARDAAAAADSFFKIAGIL